MNQPRVVYAIAESCPFDSLLVREMKRVVGSLLQLNLKRFRVPEKSMAKYSALDILKQALELLFEFGPSEKNYREAIRTIQVYSEGDLDMIQILNSGFKFVANAVYNTYAGQRCAEKLSPEILFLQGVPFDQIDVEQAFRFVGVKPPNAGPQTIKKMHFLDQGYQPYRDYLDRMVGDQPQKGREEHWVKVIEMALSESSGKALLRVGSDHLQSHFVSFTRKGTGNLITMLNKRSIEVKVVERVPDLNQVFGKH